MACQAFTGSGLLMVNGYFVVESIDITSVHIEEKLTLTLITLSPHHHYLLTLRKVVQCTVQSVV